MSILVVCPGCRKSFQVNEKFAGKKGACPKCKHEITVPTAAQEVTVHAPTEFAGGGRGVTGKLALKPVERRVTKFEPVTVAIVVAASLVVVLVTAVGGRTLLPKLSVVSAAVVEGVFLLLLSPVLAVAAYSFLRDDELEPHRGLALYVRAGICGVVYTILWGAFGYLDHSGILSGDMYSWLFVAPPIIAVGSLTAFGCFDLDFGSGLFHYAFYLLVTILLRWAAGIGWIWNK